MAIGRSFRHPGTKRVPSSEKELQLFVEKHYTKKLTEIEPSRKSAAARKVPFEIFGTPVIEIEEQDA